MEGPDHLQCTGERKARFEAEGDLRRQELQCLGTGMAPLCPVRCGRGSV